MKATKVQCQAKGMTALLADLPQIQGSKYGKAPAFSVPVTRAATQVEIQKLALFYKEHQHT